MTTIQSDGGFGIKDSIDDGVDDCPFILKIRKLTNLDLETILCRYSSMLVQVIL